MSDVSESSACTASFSVFHITAPAFNKIYYSHTLENAIFSMKAMLGQTAWGKHWITFLWGQRCWNKSLVKTSHDSTQCRPNPALLEQHRLHIQTDFSFTPINANSVWVLPNSSASWYQVWRLGIRENHQGKNSSNPLYERILKSQCCMEQTWNSSASLPCFSVIFHAVPSSALKCPFLWLFIGYHTPSAAQRALLAALGTGWQHAQPPCPAHGSATHTSRYPLGYPAWAAFTTCSPHRWAGTHEAQGLGWLALPLATPNDTWEKASAHQSIQRS